MDGIQKTLVPFVLVPDLEKWPKMAKNGQKLFFGHFLDVCISKTVGPTTFVLLTKIDQKGRFTLQKKFFGPLGPKFWDLKIEAIASQLLNG